MSFRGDREERSSTGKTNQPEPAPHGSPHLGGDDLLPPYRGGVSLQAEGTSGGGQEDSGGAPELSDSMSELIIFKSKCLEAGTALVFQHGLKKTFGYYAQHFVSDPFAGWLSCM